MSSPHGLTAFLPAPDTYGPPVMPATPTPAQVATLMATTRALKAQCGPNREHPRIEANRATLEAFAARTLGSPTTFKERSRQHLLVTCDVYGLRLARVLGTTDPDFPVEAAFGLALQEMTFRSEPPQGKELVVAYVALYAGATGRIPEWAEAPTSAGMLIGRLLRRAA